MTKCWEKRGCDEEMQSRCPHSQVATEKCPMRCTFTQCELPQHKQTWDPAFIFEPDVDRRAAIKEACTYCEFFLSHGPHM